MNPTLVTDSQNKPSRATYRLSAYIIDQQIITIILLFIALVLAITFNIHIQTTPSVLSDKNALDAQFYNKYGHLFVILNIFSFVLSVIYFAYFHVNKGATPGKKVYGLKIINKDSNTNLSYANAFFREIIKTGISFIPGIGGLINIINALILVFSKEKLGIHDRIIKTKVIEVDKAFSFLKQLLYYLILAFIGLIESILIFYFVFVLS